MGLWILPLLGFIAVGIGYYALLRFRKQCTCGHEEYEHCGSQEVPDGETIHGVCLGDNMRCYCEKYRGPR